MKKNSLIIWAIVLLLGTIGVIFYLNSSKTNNTTIDEDAKYREFNYLPELDYAAFLNKVDNGAEFYVYIGRPDCGDSVQFNKEFEELFVEFNADGTFARLKYDLANETKNFYYFDISEIIDKTSNKDMRSYYRDLHGFYFTPSLVYYKDIDNDGKSDVVNIAEWDPSLGFGMTDYLKWFYDNQLITPKVEIYHEGETDKQN